MISATIHCCNCGAAIEVHTFRKYVVCPYCDTHIPFEGFKYEEINWDSSRYMNVRKWMDCPSCRSGNMHMGPSKRVWHCPDCGYSISNIMKNTSVFWFCDDCEAFLNVQEGFTTKHKKWKCMECGHVCKVTEDNIW